MIAGASRLAAHLRRLWRAENGAAGAEMAIWAAALVVPIYGTVDLAHYTYKRMQVDAAAQAAAHRAWVLCDATTKLPAITACNGLTAAMTQAAQATSLGTGVTLGTTKEGYYCADADGKLTLVGTEGSGTTAPIKPSTFTCAGIPPGNSSTKPGEYIVVTANYTFTPLFGSLSFSQLLPTAVSRTAWMRLT